MRSKEKIEYLDPTDGQMRRYARILARRIYKKLGKKPKLILGPARGGWPGATMVAHCLKVRTVDSIGISSYGDDNKKLEQLKISTLPALGDMIGDGTDCVVVEDLVDGGDTAAKLRELYPNITIAVFFAKPKGGSRADIWVKKIAQQIWVRFPWELEPLPEVVRADRKAKRLEALQNSNTSQSLGRAA